MLATYIIQAILVTIYLLSILVFHRERKPNKLRQTRFVSRTLLAVKHTTAEFLSASSIFTASLLLVSIVQKDASSLTTSALMFIIPLNSALPVVILQLATWDMFRRSKGKLVWWVIVEALVIARFATIFLAS
jgi:hypothetical protein